MLKIKPWLLMSAGLVVLSFMTACGKESAPVYRGSGGEAAPSTSYPPPYGEQKSKTTPSGFEVETSGRVQIDISG